MTDLTFMREEIFHLIRDFEFGEWGELPQSINWEKSLIEKCLESPRELRKLLLWDSAAALLRYKHSFIRDDFEKACVYGWECNSNTLRLRKFFEEILSTPKTEIKVGDFL